MKQTIGDLWDRFTNKANWQLDTPNLEDQSFRSIEIDGYVISISPAWHWSIYRGKLEWAAHYAEATWSPVDYADENEARAAAWSTLVRISAGPEWPHEPAVRTFDDVFEFPADRAEREAREGAEKPQAQTMKATRSRTPRASSVAIVWRRTAKRE